MKLNKIRYILPAALLALSACTDEENLLQNISGSDSGTIRFAAVNGTPASISKTTLNNGWSMLRYGWDSGVAFLQTDEIAVFSTDSAASRFTASLVDRQKAIFEGEAPETSEYFALYPYQPNAKIDGNVISATIPAEQIFNGDNMDGNAALSVAYTTGDAKKFAFQNATTIISFYVNKNQYSSITLETNDGTPIAGDVDIAVPKDSLAPTVTGGTETKITISGNAYQGWVYGVILKPCSLKAGALKITFTKSDGTSFSVVNDHDVTLERGVAYRYGNIEKSNWFRLVGSSDDKADTLYAINEDEGIYQGLVNVKEWYNWVGYDELGNRYATDNDVNWGFARIHQTGIEEANAWFPGLGGYYIVTVYANYGYVEYQHIDALNLTTTTSTQAAYDASTAQWTATFSTSTNNERLNITASTTYFSTDTGQENGRGNFTFSFAGVDGTLSLDGGGITIPKAGTYKITIDLSHNSYSIEETTEEVPYYNYVDYDYGDITLGAVDNTTGFWAVHAPYVKIDKYTSMTFRFVNFSNHENFWNNFIVVLTNGLVYVDDNYVQTNLDGYKEYAVLRADNFGWGDGFGSATLESNHNWDTFLDNIDSATVTVEVVNNGNTADINCSWLGVSDGNQYYQSYKGISVDGDNLYFSLTVEGGHLIIQ